ncbi:hypothetical protein [Elioraea sp.]|uniref:hypothetical protein n=1 Tax=Elioraea sp. TaxID=2185103 RepID=UPI003F6F18D4
MTAKRKHGTAKRATPRVAPPPAPDLPAEIAAALEPGETVEAHFEFGGLVIWATGTRLFGWREGRAIDIRYTEITGARRRTADWRSLGGLGRIGLGLVFVLSGVITGFAGPVAALIGFALIAIGAFFVGLGAMRREDWVELKIDRREPPPSFWYIVLFLPFWLIMQSRRRYRVAGDPAQVDAFHGFLTARLGVRP